MLPDHQQRFCWCAHAAMSQRIHVDAVFLHDVLAGVQPAFISSIYGFDCRWEQEQQLHSMILRPLLKWQQQQLEAEGSSSTSAVSPCKQYRISSPSRTGSDLLLSSERLQTAATAVEQLLLRDVDRQAAVCQARQEMQAEQKRLEQQQQEQAVQLEQELQVRCSTPVTRH